MQHVLALILDLGVDGLDPAFLACPLGDTQPGFELAIKAPLDALGVRGHSRFLETQVDAHAGLAIAGVGLNLEDNFEILASTASYA